MTLYEYLEQTTDWEVTVWDKDYDLETYFYKTNGKDKWDKAMNDLAKLLTILKFSKEGLVVNLAEVIEKEASKKDKIVEPIEIGISKNIVNFLPFSLIIIVI